MLEKRIALVTGSNRGIGFEICRQLAKKEIKVVVSARTKAKADTAAAELSKQQLDVVSLELDVSDITSIQSAVQYINDEWGRLDIVINNAAIFIDMNKSILEVDVTTLQKTITTNTYGPIFLLQHAVPLMQKNHYGRIVNLASGAAQLHNLKGLSPSYKISKIGVNALTRIFAHELEGSNILVNSMCPGWVKTEMGGPNATRSVEEAADTAIWLATLPDDGPTSKYFRDRKETNC